MCIVTPNTSHITKMADEDTTQTNTTQSTDDVADISVGEEAADLVTAEPEVEPAEPQPEADQSLAEGSAEAELEAEAAEDSAGPVEDSSIEEAAPAEEITSEEEPAAESQTEEATQAEATDEETAPAESESTTPEEAIPAPVQDQTPGRWYVVHTYSGHENKVLENLRQKIASEHLEDKIFDMLVPTQDKIEIRSGKKEQVKEKIFQGYILVKMDLDDSSWLAIRTTPGVTSFVGMGNKPTPISEAEVRSIVQFMNQGAPATFKEVFLENDTVKIIDGPFAEFIGKVDSVDKERGKVRVLVSIFGRETPVELDFLQVQKL
jgi:transcription termination/antitermination protein NusG